MCLLRFPCCLGPYILDCPYDIGICSDTRPRYPQTLHTIIRFDGLISCRTSLGRPVICSFMCTAEAPLAEAHCLNRFQGPKTTRSSYLRRLSIHDHTNLTCARLHLIDPRSLLFSCAESLVLACSSLNAFAPSSVLETIAGLLAASRRLNISPHITFARVLELPQSAQIAKLRITIPHYRHDFSSHNNPSNPPESINSTHGEQQRNKLHRRGRTSGARGSIVWADGCLSPRF